MTADGRQSQTGGCILWNIIKAREPNAYKEIMKKTKEFEKQFKRPNIRQETEQGKEVSSQKIADASMNLKSEMQHQDQQSNGEGKRVSVHDRLRMPVSYDDDLLGGDQPKDDEE